MAGRIRKYPIFRDLESKSPAEVSIPLQLQPSLNH